MASWMRRLKDSRLAWPFKAGIRQLGNRLTQISASKRGQALDRFTADCTGFLRWVLQSLRGLKPDSTAPRRLLTIYDLTSQPFSIGDIITVQQASLIVRAQHQLGDVDFAVVYDPKRPTCPDPAFAHINADNILYHLASVLPAAQVNPHHGSLFFFNSPQELHKFIATRGQEYHVWPSAWEFSRGAYHYSPILDELLHHHYVQHGDFPRLGCRPFLVDWAQRFYRDQVAPAVPVTVQIRRNKTMAPGRNSRLDCWLDLFRHCEHRYPVQFVVICARSEIDERLRRCRNVVLAKDHDTGIEQDLALVQTSAFHMGTSSGPAMMAIFNARPYLFVNAPVPLLRDHLRLHDGFWQYEFATPFQLMTDSSETSEMLITQFERMWTTVNREDWQGADSTSTRALPLSWMR